MAVAACLGLMVGVHSDPVVAGATVVAVAVSTTWRVRVCCAIVGTGMLLDVPWVILPAIAGGVWALWPRPVRVVPRSPSPRVGWTLAAVVTGLIAGVLAWAPLLRHSFGLAHLHGLFGGAVRVVLAAVFSLDCTALHLRAGLWMPVLAHIIADLIIFAAAFPHVSFSGWWTPG